MASAYDVGVETPLDDCTGTGFYYGLPRYSRGAMGALLEFGFDPLGLFGGEQT
jgi:hypothetical protein